MHDQPKAAPTEAEDLRNQSAVLVHVVKSHPATLRLSDLTRELGDPDGFAERDAIERAVRELIQFGLLFRCEGAVLPTRCAHRAYEVLGG